MSAQTICVKGPALRVAIVGAVLARKWLGADRRLVVMPEDVPEAGQSLLARPDHLKLHAELELAPDQLTNTAKAKPVLAPSYLSHESSLALPFSPIGTAQFGVDFHHFWMRANGLSKQDDLLAFSPAIAIEGAEQKPSISQLVQAGIAFGLELDARVYAELLLANAKGRGADLVQPSESTDFDLTIDCNGSNAPGWTNSVITLLSPPDLPGLEWQLCVNAAHRFVSLSSDLGETSPEQREYNRLAAHEVERIADMVALLSDADPTSTERPTLKRKLDVFAACGRIPTEDFEVFTPPEWLAALWGRGIRPRRFDRMAGLMPEAKLTEWMTGLRAQTRALAGGTR